MTDIYHITHIRNLPLILAHNGLYASNHMESNGIERVNIAHTNIQSRRAQTKVPVSPHGNLHDYVPFYFAPRSPMLYAISRGYVEGYTEGQAPILHLVTSAQRIAQAKVPFVFTDGHAIVAYSHFYNDLADFKKIDWDIMRVTYWNDTAEDNDRTRRRNAEFLVWQSLLWSLVTEIGVLYQDTQRSVLHLLEGQPHQPKVVLRRNWYYL